VNVTPFEKHLAQSFVRVYAIAAVAVKHGDGSQDVHGLDLRPSQDPCFHQQRANLDLPECYIAPSAAPAGCGSAKCFTGVDRGARDGRRAALFLDQKAIRYWGCAAERSSGNTVQRTPLSKQRNKHLQTTLIEAAKMAPRNSPNLALVYERE
jgi:hypothetical protein